MSQPPSYPGSGDNPENPGEYPPPPTHQSYGSGPSGQEQPAYGQQPSAPWQQQQPGQFGQYQNWQGGNDASRPTDGVSIAAFVLSLTCCLSLIGLILGFVGLSRTKNDQRKGRWAAVTAIPVGIIGTLILGGAIVGIVWYAGKVVTPDNAEVGQCVNIEDGDDNTITLMKSDCGDDHDAQIYAVEKLSAEDAKEIDDNGGRASVNTCLSGMEKLSKYSPDGTGHLDLDGKRATMGWATEDPKDPKAGDTVICYFEADSGDLNKSYVD
ncbi:DUF4190 domain-containing protein [Nocardioides daejeonensis]|uniref:DUF4190 domain-containing protein n=1 Tax=Nocardioides daejeonensis TaxID=1046556 RepID=UPI000D746EFF|nr:DUF4190 domain-containing protein [Nocardioides daejeonensis]